MSRITPVTGRRILIKSGEDRAEILAAFVATTRAFAEEQKRLGEERRRAAGNAERRELQILDERMITRAVANRRHPHMFAAVHVDGRDTAVRRLEDRKSIDRQLRTRPRTLRVLVGRCVRRFALRRNLLPARPE